MSVAAPADRRFKRARVRPTPPRRRWARIVAALELGTLAAVAALAVYGGYHLTMRTDLLRVREVRVRGNARVTGADVQAALVHLRGASIFLADLHDGRARLAASPWVADATLRRVLPDVIDVSVTERTPIGIARFEDGLFLLSADGTLLDAFGPRYADLDLPLVDGFPGRAERGAQLEPERASLASRVLTALGTRPDLLRRVLQVDVSDAHNVVALLEGDPALLHLGEQRFVERLQSYLELAPALHDRVPAIDYVDLRFGRRVYLRPAGAPAAVNEGRASAAARPASDTMSGR